MRRLAPLIAGLSFCCGLAAADDAPTPAQRAEALARHGLDPASSLGSRVGETPASVLKMFKELGGPPPTPHLLTDAERAKLSAAFEGLPPLHRRVLGERLRTVSFLDGMPNTALTSTVNPDEPYRLFDMTIRAGVLADDVSRWMTWKDRTCFVEAEGSAPRVSIEAGSLDAILYILLHEGTHVVDSALRITPAPKPDGRPADPFVDGVWADRLTLAPRYRDPLLESIRYRAGGKPLPADRAEALYAALGKTPFVSLYGSSNWHDDLAESLALYHLTEVLKQPYRIVVRGKDGVEAFAYEPTKSDLVRGRFAHLKRFYEDAR